ncbi:MAG: transaldolase family protein, partial [Desulfobacterales bacterium]
MKATQQRHEFGQSLWLDHITRELLNSGTLKRWSEELSVTGLTSNPCAFYGAIKNGTCYDAAIRQKLHEDKMGAELYYDIALEDLRHAADLFGPVYEKSDGVDGWVSLEVSPFLTHDPQCTLTLVKDLFARLRRPNIFIEIPGTNEGLWAVEEAIFAGIPVNVTLLYSREHYLAAAGAFLRGIERRIVAGFKPDVGSVVSISVSPWDAAVRGRVPDALRNKLGVAVARRTYKACCESMISPRWQRAYNAGARPQRLRWTGTEIVDAGGPGDFYIRSLAAPFSVITVSEKNLNALAQSDDIAVSMPCDGGDCEVVLACFAAAGIDIDDLAVNLQAQGAAAAVISWI